jgi:GT2 family glycosyltransferase
VDDPRFETLVVDNNAAPAAVDAEVLAEAGFRVVHEEHRGLDYARNRGIAEAEGDIVVFIDDDCEAHPNWLAGLRCSFIEHDAACVTGRVVPNQLDRRSHRWFEAISGFDRGLKMRRFFRSPGAYVMPGSAAQLGTGCNMAFRRDVFDRVGPFDPALDMGTAVGGGGDIDMFIRLLHAGELVIYAPGAVVRHSHRDTLWSLARQLFGYSVSVGALSVKYGGLRGRSRRRGLLRHQWSWLTWIVDKTVIRPEGSRFIGVPLLLLCLLGDVCGPIAYQWAKWKSRRVSRP